MRRAIALGYRVGFVDKLAVLGVLVPTLTWVVINVCVRVDPNETRESRRCAQKQTN